jgi:hypothetical protein
MKKLIFSFIIMVTIRLSASQLDMVGIVHSVLSHGSGLAWT